MSKLKFYFVDVFAEEKYAGNQLAVFRGGGDLSSADMLQIAREMHFSETTFILSETPRDGGFDVRIFSPKEELPFAGHPTLGTAHILHSEVLGGKALDVTLNLKVGKITVTFGLGEDNTVAWMKQIKPTFGSRLKIANLAPVLNLRPDEFDERFPIEEVSTGLPHILVPLKKLDSLKRARIVPDKYYDLIKTTWAKPVMIFCPEPYQPKNDISVRMFADAFGIPEDPATGSGNGCLAAYLAHHRYWGKPEINVRSDQGYEVGRPSLLYLKAEEVDGEIQVHVGGKSVTVARGEFV